MNYGTYYCYYGTNYKLYNNQLLKEVLHEPLGNARRDHAGQIQVGSSNTCCKEEPPFYRPNRDKMEESGSP